MQANSSQLFNCGRWLVCAPSDYDVRYKINEWMDPDRSANQAVALTQWTTLHHHIIRLGGWLEYVSQATGWPDMVFTANAGLVRGKKVVLSKFRHKERAGEESYFKEWFHTANYNLIELRQGAFEGEGDALFAGETLFCGYGFRSDRAALDEVATQLDIKQLVAVKLQDPFFYHLDTCFSPITPELALVHPGAFSTADLELLGRYIELIHVPYEDAVKFVCNAVVLGKNIVLPAGCNATYKALAARGFTSYAVDMTEFIKAGGAAKCLVLKLD